MKQTSKRLVSLIIALVFVVAALVMLFDFIQPEYQVIETVKGQVVAEQNFLQTETEAVAKAKSIVDNFAAQSKNNAAVGAAMPAGEDVAGALAQVYGIAQNNGLAIQAVSISAPSLQSPAQAADRSQAQPVAPNKIVKPLGVFSMQITGAGSYESLKNFLSGIETNVRIFDVKGLTVVPGQAAAKSQAFGGQDFFSYTMMVMAYYQTN